LLFLFGNAVSLDTGKTRIALVMEGSSAQAVSLAQAFQNSPYFDVTMARSMQPVRNAMVDGDIRGIFVIPENFGSALKRGRAVPIQIITDGSEPNSARFIAAYGEGVLANWAQSQIDGHAARARLKPAIEVSARTWFNSGLESRNFLVPGSIASVMAIIGTMLTALVVAREWERGTMEAMMATPISMAEFILSKVLPYFLLAMGAMAICAVIAIFFFDVPFRGSVLALVAISAAFLLPALGLGLFISAATKNQFVASQLAAFAGFLPTFLLSGFIYEIASMPWPIQAITYVVPARYLIPALQTVFLAGDLWGLILPNIAAMVALGLFFAFLAFRVTRRSLD
jgi:ABC-2 type transport system permease protein